MADENRFGEKVTFREAISRLYNDNGEVGLEIDRSGKEVIIKQRRDNICPSWRWLGGSSISGRDTSTLTLIRDTRTGP